MYGTVIILDDIKSSISLLPTFQKQLAANGNLFVMVTNEVGNNGDVVCDFFDVIAAASEMGMSYVNTIVVPMAEKVCSELPDNVMYVVWMAASKEHFFCKDAIREPHIWKNIEWGRRTKNYHPRGKDPGNVWIPTIDDGRANITKHILLDLPGVINRICACSCQDATGMLLVTSHDTDSWGTNPRLEVMHMPARNAKSHKNVKPTYAYNRTPRLEREPRGTIIWGTSERMTHINNESVKVVITSPPYWDLKDYFKTGQIGQEGYATYLSRLNLVWKGCYDKLSDDGSLWINVNIRVKNGKPILLPHDIIAQCKRIGFHYKGVIIWHKSSGIPTHEKNIVDRHEYVLVFSKGRKLIVNDSITHYTDYKNDSINGGLFWNINRKAGSVGKHFMHPAIYPNELVARIVRSATNTGDTVLDPFLGSGTTVIAALNEGCNAVGYEYNEGFKELIDSRIHSEVSKLHNNITYI